MTHLPRALLWILLLAVLLRVGAALYLGDTTPPRKDESAYALLAARLATGYGYSFADGYYPFTQPGAPTAHWSFLYTGFVAAIYALAGEHPLTVRLVQAVLTGLLMPWLTWRLFRRAFVGSAGRWSRTLPARGVTGDQAALIAAFLAAIYAYFVLYGAMVQTEGLFLLGVLWALERTLTLHDALTAPRDAGAEGRPGAPHGRPGWMGAAVTLGVSIGVATLLRQSFLPMVAVLFGWLLVMNVRLGRRQQVQTMGALAVAGLLLALLIAPFTVRNYLVYGEFLLLNSNAGYAMYSAQHPMHGINFAVYDAAPIPDDLEPAPATEAQWDRALMARGIQFVVEAPGRFLLLSASRALIYFEFWPKPTSPLLFNVGRIASFALFLPFMLYGAWCVWRNAGEASSRRAGLLLLFAACYSLLHIFTWAMSRYRLPVDAVMLLFAAVALTTVGNRLRHGRTLHQ